MQTGRRPTMILAELCAVITGGLGSRVAEVRLDLREGWAIQSSAKVAAGGEAVSRPGFATAGWHCATVPTTVVSALVADGTYPDSYYGTNLREIPGVTYKVGVSASDRSLLNSNDEVLRSAAKMSLRGLANPEGQPWCEWRTS